MELIVLHNANHWGLAVLHKDSATIRIYGCSHSLFSFTDLLPTLLDFASSIQEVYGFIASQWPAKWIISPEILSKQQGNSYDCTIFTMFIAYYASRGIVRPSVYSGERINEVYRSQKTASLRNEDLENLIFI